MARAKKRLVLIHWKEEESKPLVARLRELGFAAEWIAPRGGAGLKQFTQSPPNVFVVDLSRMPSQGMWVGFELRRRKATCGAVVLFIGGADDKVEKTRRMLPDATFLRWEDSDARLRRAIDQALPGPPPKAPPGGEMAQYANVPLAKKLGVEPGIAVVPIGAPEDLCERLGITVGAPVGQRVLLFVRSSDDLFNGFDAAARRVSRGGALWVIWPKKSSGVRTDLSEQSIRELANDSGWTDYKVCAVDATWSGLLFAPRKK